MVCFICLIVLFFVVLYEFLKLYYADLNQKFSSLFYFIAHLFSQWRIVLGFVRSCCGGGGGSGGGGHS
jgi:hypothetical protein